MFLQDFMSVNENLNLLLEVFYKNKSLIWFLSTIMESRFLPSRTSSLVRGFLPIRGSSPFVRNIGSDLLSRRDISAKFLSRYLIFGRIDSCNFLV